MKYTFQFQAAHKIAEDTYEAVLAPSERERGFSLLAGQYVQITLPYLAYSDPKGPSRVFSLASSPCEEKCIAVAFRDTGSGFKRTLVELAEGEEVLVEGPSGFFTLPESPSSPVVWVAGGIGITPCLSMLRYLQDCAKGEEKNRRHILLYANRDRAYAAYLNELEKRAKAHHCFSLRTSFGPLAQEVLRETKKRVGAQAWWYVVGPPGMVALARSELQRAGIDMHRILTEEFSGYA